RDPLPHANERSSLAVIDPDPSAGNANRGDNRRAMLHWPSRKNRRWRARAFLPCKLGDRKFPLFAPRHKKFLRNSDRDQPVRDTSSLGAGEVQAFSLALDSKCVAASSHAAYVYESSLGFL